MHFMWNCQLFSRTITRYSTSFTSTRSAFKLVYRLVKQEKMAAVKPQPFDYFLVLDFEATCQKNERLIPQEIIEFPVLKVNAQTFEVEDQFHQYVQPRVNKMLTPFCTELTGIVQDMVDGQQHVEDVLKDFDAWMVAHSFGDGGQKTSAFVTCGDWDLKTMLPSQEQYFNLNVAKYFRRWVNIKRVFADTMKHYPKRDMMGMLKDLKLEHQGRHHSGIDDCKNIARILKALAEKGAVINITGRR
ncbi:ERI1 exoribonuclease 3-like isoform X1 [Lineus longissimus]|uniref:ERI1 exoribonuclease 3-like isoform X1 n=1 Tax=Lineus longissimus TaxID=88925 RepID=UPI002B4F2FC2